MNMTPTLEQVAKQAARHAVSEFTVLASWLSYEDELAKQFLADPAFVCAAEYATRRAMDLIRHNKQMQARAAQAGGGARGNAYVIGMIVGEWVGGHTTIDAELGSW